MYTILIIEDEQPIRDMLNFSLSTADLTVLESANAEEGWQVLTKEKPDLVIVDWMLPVMSGVDFIEKVRSCSDYKNTPIMLLTAKGAEEDQVDGFDAGADDYVVKPFSPKALVARCHALLRRLNPQENKATKLTSTKLTLDLSSHRFSVNGQEVKLGPIEFKIIKFFMSNPNKVYAREHLLEQVWGNRVVVEERTVDVHIRRLRKILEEVDAADTIQTVRGSGYRFFD